jgi:hypothetical protein
MPTGAAPIEDIFGQAFGMLETMQADIEKDLGVAQKQELQAVIQFQKLRSAKMGELLAASAQQEEKEKVLAETQDKRAQAKKDIMVTQDALSADEAFLLQLGKSCSQNEEEHDERVKARAEEVLAITEALKILTTDDARDLFVGTMTHDSFLQVGRKQTLARGARSRRKNAGATARDAARNEAVSEVMGKLFHMARRHKDWAMSTLAVSVRLDSFTKVKEMMDKMLAELKVQQKAEFDKKDHCVADIANTEYNIEDKNHVKEKLEGKKLDLEGTIASLEASIKVFKEEIADMQVSVKRAGEDRHNENAVFQKSVADQRGVIQVLEKAQRRLQAFYGTMNVSLAQTGGRQPGVANAPEPTRAKAYEKQGTGATGVLMLLSNILADATKMESSLIADEQAAQTSYEYLHKDMIKTIQANELAITEKEALLERARGAMSETEGTLLFTGEELEKLAGVLHGTHLDCDYLLKYFDVRQQARSEEMGAIVEAKAILSGADFGKAQEEAEDAEEAR